MREPKDDAKVGSFEFWNAHTTPSSERCSIRATFITSFQMIRELFMMCMSKFRRARRFRKSRLVVTRLSFDSKRGNPATLIQKVHHRITRASLGSGRRHAVDHSEISP